MSGGSSPNTANAKPKRSPKKAKATVEIVARKDVDQSCNVYDGTGSVCGAHPDRPCDGFSTRSDAVTAEPGRALPRVTSGDICRGAKDRSAGLATSRRAVHLALARRRAFSPLAWPLVGVDRLC